MRATYVRQVSNAGDSGNLDLSDLTETERLAYQAGRDQARADRWRIDAEISERRGEPSNTAREYQRQHEAEAANAWRQLAAAKGRGGAE
jgi:hypothetical protein